MKNLLFIGQRTFLLNGRKERVYPGGTEVVSNNLMNVLKDEFNIYYMFHSAQGYSEEYKNAYPYCKDIMEIPEDMNILRNYIKDNNIDLVLVSSWFADIVVKCITDVLYNVDIPVFVYTHGNNSSMGYAELYANKVKSKDDLYIICCTDNEYNRNKDSGIPESRIFKIDNCVYLTDEQLDVDGYKFESNNKAVIIARMLKSKGIPNSTEVLFRINKKVDIIGKKFRGHVERDLNKRYGNDFHTCLGVLDREDIMDRLKNYDLLFCLPIEEEGMSLSLLEANSLGVPVVTWNDWAFPDYLDNEFNIFLDHNDKYIDQFINEFYPKLDFYLNEDNRRELKRRSIERYGIGKFKKNILSILNNMEVK